MHIYIYIYIYIHKYMIMYTHTCIPCIPKVGRLAPVRRGHLHAADDRLPGGVEAAPE